MKIAQPDYFEIFQCLAGKCPDSCCHEWEIQVEESAAEFYRGLSGELGDRLRKALADRDGETVLEMEDERCPMWRKDGLCAIQADLGHDAPVQNPAGNFPELPTITEIFRSDSWN